MKDQTDLPDLIAILNASPTILMAKIGFLDQLQKLFSSIVIPPVVMMEISKKKTEEFTIINQFIQHPQVVVTSETVSQNFLNGIQSDRLGQGEFSVLALAQDYQHKNQTVIAIIDDKPARNLAKMLQIQVIGTVGLIILAKEKYFISKNDGLNFLNNLLRIGAYLDSLLIEKARNILNQDAN